MIELLILIGVGAACKGIVASASGEESKKKGKKKLNEEYNKLMSGKSYSWTNHWEDPVTGDYVKHWIDIDVK